MQLWQEWTTEIYPREDRTMAMAFFTRKWMIAVIVMICVLSAIRQRLQPTETLWREASSIPTIHTSRNELHPSIQQKNHSFSYHYPHRHTKNTTIFHLHIQKAGGTAVAAVLGNRLCNCSLATKRPKQCRTCPTVQLLNGYTASSFQSRLTTGWGCGVHATLHHILECPHHQNLSVGSIFEDDLAIVTFLRDPMERVISEYKFCANRKKCWDWRPPKNLTLENYAQFPPAAPFHNRQMKMLSGCDPHTTDWSDAASCESCLERAQQNVVDHTLAFVGLHEHAVWYLQQLATVLLGNSHKTIALPQGDTHAWESGEGRVQVSEEQLRNATTILTLRHNNRYDIALYNFTKALLYQRYGRPPSLPR